MHILLALFVNILFSAVYPLGKIAMIYCPPFLLVGIRMLCAGIIYLVCLWLLNKSFFPKTRDFFRKVILLGIFNIFLTNAFEFWGLQYMSAAKTSFIYNLSPFFSAIFAYLHFEEKVTFKKMLGLGISFLGFIPIFKAMAPGEIDLHHLLFFSTAELSLVIAAIATVYGWIIMQDIVRKDPNNIAVAHVANALSMIVGSFFSFGLAIFAELPYYQFHRIPLSGILYFIGLLLCISVMTVIIYGLYSHLLTIYTATFMTMIGMTGPLFSAFFDWLFFGTIVSTEFFIAIALVFFGLYLFYQEDLRLGYMLEK